MGILNQEAKLSDLTYYNIGGTAAAVYLPSSVSELQNWLASHFPPELPLAVLGCGSNVVFSDSRFEGTVLSCRNLTSWHWLSESSLYCEAGVTNTELSEIGLEAGFKDAAWLYRMPGQLGATVRMNARCYGGEISHIVTDVYTLTLAGAAKHYTAQDLFKGYKDTVLMRQKEIVFAAVIHFQQPAAFDEILEEMKRNESDRHRKQHFRYPSCGSTFKNNHALGKPSGKIFEELGLKGLSIGQAQISNDHGNFVYNTGQATAHDVLELAKRMRQAALKHNMNLELEVQPIGVFDAALADDLALRSLDTTTVEISQTQVLTGVLSSARPSQINYRNTEETLSFACPFVGWNRALSASLGQVQFIVRQIAWSNSSEQQLAPPTGQFGATTQALQIAFLAESAAHCRQLLSKTPSGKGFQDKLWESSVFECFIFSRQSERYLELEIHSRNDWLALVFDSYRIRAATSRTPAAATFAGIKTFDVLPNGQIKYTDPHTPDGLVPFPVQTGPLTKQARHSPESAGGTDGQATDPFAPIGMGFEVPRAFLEKIFESNELELEIRGAYAHGPKRIYAVAPGRGDLNERSQEQPDFHKKMDTLCLRLD